MGSTQMVVQGLSFISGILIVRRLPLSQYAYYTIASAMLATMQILSDGGIVAGVISQGGRVWQDRVELGKVVATGLALRRRFAAFSALGIPLLLYFMMHHNASLTVSLLILTAMVPTYLASLSDSLLEVGPKLHQAIAPLQKNQIETAFGRSILTVITVFTWPTCALALLSTGISRTLGNMRLRKLVLKYADRSQKPDPEYQRRILKVVWRILPESVYYCISGQLTVWIISIFGSTVALGEVGGLNGLTQAMTLLTTLMTSLLVPRYARLPDKKPLLIQRFLMSQVALVLLGVVMTGSVALLHKPLLWVLGKQFAGLKEELTLAFGSACMTLLNATTNQLLSARGYVVPPAVFIGFVLTMQVLLAFVVPLHDVAGVLLYGLLTAFCSYGIRFVYFFIQMRNHHPEPAAA